MCLARFTTEILKSEILPFKSVNSDPCRTFALSIGSGSDHRIKEKIASIKS